MFCSDSSAAEPTTRLPLCLTLTEVWWLAWKSNLTSLDNFVLISYHIDVLTPCPDSIQIPIKFRSSSSRFNLLLTLYIVIPLSVGSPFFNLNIYWEILSDVRMSDVFKSIIFSDTQTPVSTLGPLSQYTQFTKYMLLCAFEDYLLDVYLLEQSVFSFLFLLLHPVTPGSCLFYWETWQ